jgi:hypothetical protein
MQAAEMRSVLDKHLDRMQQQVLDLHYDGYSETAIAEQLGIALISLQRIRKTIASLAEGLNLGDDQTRRGSQMAEAKWQKAEGKKQEARSKRQEARGKRQEARGKRQEKIVSKNGNYPDGLGADYD